jgi:hypothetical protein
MVGDFGHLFKQARWYTKAGRADSSIKWIVLHVMQAPEKLSTAEGTQNYFASTSVKASTHFSCDADSTIQSVMIADVAYGAGGANAAGVHIEQAGYSEQSAADWSDEYSQRMLVEQVAPLVGRLAARLQIPLRFVDAAGLKRGDRGVTTHKQCSDAFGGSHWDPGLAYPMGQVLDVARLWVAGTSTTAPPAPGPSTPTPLPVFPSSKGNPMQTLQRGEKIWHFTVTSDGRLRHSYWAGAGATAWSLWELGSGCDPHSPISAIFAPEGSTDWQVFVPTTDGRVLHAWWYAPEARAKSEFLFG